jgi:hypothetical protein
MIDIKVDELMNAISEDYQEHAERIQTVIRDLMVVMSAVNHMARAKWDNDLALLVVLDTMFTFLVDYGRCKLNLDDEDMKALGEIFRLMVSEYPSIVKSKDQWAALTPFLSLSKAREYFERTAN